MKELFRLSNDAFFALGPHRAKIYWNEQAGYLLVHVYLWCPRKKHWKEIFRTITQNQSVDEAISLNIGRAIQFIDGYPGE